MKPLNNGPVGAKGLALYSEVVLYWEFFIIKALNLYTMLSEMGSAIHTLLSLVHSRLVDRTLLLR